MSSSYTPIIFKPIGTPPVDKPDLAFETTSAWLDYIRAILEGAEEEPTGLSEHIAYKLEQSRGGEHLITPEECFVLSEAFLLARDEDITRACPNLGDDGIETCRGFGCFCADCADCGGITVLWQQEGASSS